MFGPGRIVWVEGKTEEQAFPLIALKHGVSLTGARMLSVVNTGDFNRRLFNRRLIGTTSKIYQQLTAGVALIPPACGFLFDRERWTDEEQERLKQACAGKLELLPRRMYENYLLDPEAIAAVLTEWLLAHRPEALSEIADLLARMLGENAASAPWPTASPPE